MLMLTPFILEHVAVTPHERRRKSDNLSHEIPLDSYASYGNTQAKRSESVIFPKSKNRLTPTPIHSRVAVMKKLAYLLLPFIKRMAIRRVWRCVVEWRAGGMVKR